MEYRYRVQTFKYLISAATAAAALIITIVMCYLSEWLGVLLFFVIVVLFGWFTISNGAVIIVAKDEIRKTFWGITLSRVSWAMVQEVGVVGTKIFKASDTKLQGERYIYLSPKKLDENERFQLALKWPPRNMVYFYYTKERMDQIQLIWDNVVDSYNAGDVFF